MVCIKKQTVTNIIAAAQMCGNQAATDGKSGYLAGASAERLIHRSQASFTLCSPIKSTQLVLKHVLKIIEHPAEIAAFLVFFPIFFRCPTRSTSSQPGVEELGGLLHALGVGRSVVDAVPPASKKLGS